MSDETYPMLCLDPDTGRVMKIEVFSDTYVATLKAELEQLKADLAFAKEFIQRNSGNSLEYWQENERQSGTGEGEWE